MGMFNSFCVHEGVACCELSNLDLHQETIPFIDKQASEWAAAPIIKSSWTTMDGSLELSWLSFFVCLKKGGSRLRIFWELGWFFRLEKRRYWLGMSALLIVRFFELLIPYAIGVIIDHGVKGSLTPLMLWKWSLLILGAGVGAYGCRFLWRTQIFGASQKLGKLLRERFYQYLTQRSPSFYQKNRIGDLMAHGTNDIQSIIYTAGDGVMIIVDGVIGAVVMVMSMALFINPLLTLVALLPMPMIAIASRYYGHQLHRRFRLSQESFSEMTEKVRANITSMRLIKAFGRQQAEVESFDRTLDRVVDRNLAVARLDALYEPTIVLVVGCSFLLTIAFGSHLVLTEVLTIGQLTQFTMYVGELIWPMLAFGWLFNLVERGRASYDRLQQLMQQKDKIIEVENPIVRQPQGDIRIKINAFCYPGSQRIVLKGIDLKIPQGTTLGIVGKTGSGKTTLIRLLLREYDLTDGEIWLDDQPQMQYALSALRSAIGYVPQEHMLFSATIEENIAFGEPFATRERVVQAAKDAQIHEDILRFPKQYETIVGEKGVTLSGGQKQRLSIARTILLQPEILILDDSLSAVDASTEQAIVQMIQQQRRGKTTIIIAHRMSAVEHADQIVVLEQGVVVQQGDHQRLSQEPGWYQQMLHQQQTWI